MDDPLRPPPGQPHWTLAQEAGKPCPYCRTRLHDHEQVIVCPSCHVPHHLECWIDNGRCTTYGCPEVAALGLRRHLRPDTEGTGPLQINLGPVRPVSPTFDYGFYRVILWFGLLSLIGNVTLLLIHGPNVATVGQPFSFLFGLLTLAMTQGLFRYLRTIEAARLAPGQRRRMRAAVYLGIIIGLAQWVVTLVVLKGYLEVPPP